MDSDFSPDAMLAQLGMWHHNLGGVASKLNIGFLILSLPRFFEGKYFLPCILFVHLSQTHLPT
jgi:hypothetical protein